MYVEMWRVCPLLLKEDLPPLLVNFYDKYAFNIFIIFPMCYATTSLLLNYGECTKLTDLYI